MNEALTLAIIQSLLTYGPTAVIQISQAMQAGSVTAEDIKALKIDKSPEDYFAS